MTGFNLGALLAKCEELAVLHERLKVVLSPGGV